MPALTHLYEMVDHESMLACTHLYETVDHELPYAGLYPPV